MLNLERFVCRYINSSYIKVYRKHLPISSFPFQEKNLWNITILQSAWVQVSTTITRSDFCFDFFKIVWWYYTLLVFFLESWSLTTKGNSISKHLQCISRQILNFLIHILLERKTIEMITFNFKNVCWHQHYGCWYYLNAFWCQELREKRIKIFQIFAGNT